MVGDVLSNQGFDVTVGETFGASQRGGSVMSHLRISTQGNKSPQIPKGHGHMVISLEPIEAIRVLLDYGNPAVKVITNTHPIHPISVICGDKAYPDHNRITQWLNDLSQQSWLINTTEKAAKLGHPIFSNVIMVGALSATGELPLTAKDFEKVIRQRMSLYMVALNLKAFEIGSGLLEATTP
jgi:indolepyruvate ferredoxin oxidoreductase beta subunit